MCDNVGRSVIHPLARPRTDLRLFRPILSSLNRGSLTLGLGDLVFRTTFDPRQVEGQTFK